MAASHPNLLDLTLIADPGAQVGDKRALSADEATELENASIVMEQKLGVWNWDYIIQTFSFVGFNYDASRLVALRVFGVHAPIVAIMFATRGTQKGRIGDIPIPVLTKDNKTKMTTWATLAADVNSPITWNKRTTTQVRQLNPSRLMAVMAAETAYGLCKADFKTRNANLTLQPWLQFPAAAGIKMSAAGLLAFEEFMAWFRPLNKMKDEDKNDSLELEIIKLSRCLSKSAQVVRTELKAKDTEKQLWHVDMGEDARNVYIAKRTALVAKEQAQKVGSITIVS